MSYHTDANPPTSLPTSCHVRCRICKQQQLQHFSQELTIQLALLLHRSLAVRASRCTRGGGTSMTAEGIGMPAELSKYRGT